MESIGLSTFLFRLRSLSLIRSEFTRIPTVNEEILLIGNCRFRKQNKQLRKTRERTCTRFSVASTVRSDIRFDNDARHNPDDRLRFRLLLRRGYGRVHALFPAQDRVDASARDNGGHDADLQSN